VNINTAAYWDAAWGRAHEGYRADTGRMKTIRYIQERLPTGARVLDIGGGCGMFAETIKDKHTVKVLDFSQYAVDYLRAIGIDAEVADITAYEGQVYGTFDVAVCTDFIEHLDEPQTAVRCAYENASRAFFAVPDNCMGPDSCQEHLRVYTREGLADELRMWPHIRIEPETIGFNIIAEVWR
jgi:2-polyprenyl-3-methyl-5-hydroxy-6-metoxy-1,4-benzoquinol methylase